jgi:hypothetical protein
MVAVIMFQSEALDVALGFLVLCTLVAFVVAVGYYAVRGVFALVRKIRAVLWGEPFSVPTGLQIRGRDGRWRNVIGAAFMAVALAALFSTTLQAGDLVMSCEWIPWWTVEWWFYCYGR